MLKKLQIKEILRQCYKLWFHHHFKQQFWISFMTQDLVVTLDLTKLRETFIYVIGGQPCYNRSNNGAKVVKFVCIENLVLFQTSPIKVHSNYRSLEYGGCWLLWISKVLQRQQGLIGFYGLLYKVDHCNSVTWHKSWNCCESIHQTYGLSAPGTEIFIIRQWIEFL